MCQTTEYIPSSVVVGACVVAAEVTSGRVVASDVTTVVSTRVVMTVVGAWVVGPVGSTKEILSRQCLIPSIIISNPFH